MRLIPEFGTLIPTSDQTTKRRGRYAGSRYRQAGSKRYIVVAYFDGDYAPYINQGMTDEEIVLGCMTYLNTPAPRKKYAKKTPKAPYGSLSLINYKRKINESGAVYFTVTISTDQRKNKNFWGVGING